VGTSSHATHKHSVVGKVHRVQGALLAEGESTGTETGLVAEAMTRLTDGLKPNGLRRAKALFCQADPHDPSGQPRHLGCAARPRRIGERACMSALVTGQISPFSTRLSGVKFEFANGIMKDSVEHSLWLLARE
jgi:hypothetical protein